MKVRKDGIIETQPVSASSLPLPTGAATAANQLPDGHNVTVDNASLAVTGTFWQATQPVSAASLPLPTGASTLAEQQSQTTHLATIAGDTTSLDGKDLMLGTDFSSVFGSASVVDGSNHLQVDIASDSVGIGGGTQYTEGDTDTTITGTAILWEDSGNTLRAVSNSKALPVEQHFNGTAATTNSGNVDGGTQRVAIATNDVNMSAINTNTTAIETNTDFGAVVGGGVEATALRVTLASDSTGLVSVDDGGGSLTVDGTFWQATQPVSAASLPLPTGASTLAEQQSQTTHLATIAGDTTSLDGKDLMLGTDFSTVLGTTNLRLATQQDNLTNSSDGLLTTGFNMVYDGTAWDRMLGDSTNGTLVNLGTNNDITMATLPDTAAGDLATLSGAVSGTEMQVDVITSALPTGAATAANQLPDGHNVTIDNGSGIGAVHIQDGGNSITVDGSVTADLGANNDVTCTGAVAEGAAYSENPVPIGVEARTTNPTAVDDGDIVSIKSDDTGRPIVVHNAPRDLVAQQHTSITTASETTILTAGGAGVFHDLTKLVVTNSSSTSVTVDLRDDTAGTVVAQFAIAPKGGIVLDFNTPMVQGLAADNWTLQSDTAVSTLEVFVQAVKNV